MKRIIMKTDCTFVNANDLLYNKERIIFFYAETAYTQRRFGGPSSAVDSVRLTLR